MGPINGYLIDRLGPRRMVFVGCFILGGGFLFFSQVDSLWQFYLAFMIMSLGVELGTWLAVMTALNNWFVKQRATAMAGAMEGFALGGVILVPLLAWSVDPDDFGLDRWRAIAAGIGVFTMIVAFPCAMLVRDRPPRSGRNPERPSTRGTPASLETAPAAEGHSPDYTLRYVLWLLLWPITFPWPFSLGCSWALDSADASR